MSRILASVLACVVLLGLIGAGRAGAGEPWVSGYYPGWEKKRLPPAELPLDAVTHLFQFALTIGPDGGLDQAGLGIDDAHIAETVAAAREAGKKVIIVLGGAESGDGFRGATAEGVRERFIGDILAFVKKHGYDGVDIDWEPLRKDEVPQYRRFVVELRAALRAHDPASLLTTATAPAHGETYPEEVHAELQEAFDQINVMTYVMSGAWDGWVTWHGSALGNGRAAFPNGRPLPTIENTMAAYVAAGVRPEKLGIGLAFHGTVWTGGVTGPRQGWTTPPTVEQDVAYGDIVSRFHRPDRARFDEAAQNAYLSIDEPGTAEDRFIDYSDARGIAARLRFMEERGYGGCIVWNLAQGRTDTGEQPLAAAIAAYLEERGRR